MNRRTFFKLLSTGVLGAQLDIEKLLWIPGQMIAVPSSFAPSVSLSDIIKIEMERIAPQLETLFERDSAFYTSLDRW